MSKKLLKYPEIAKLLPLLESLNIPENNFELKDLCVVLQYDCNATCAECPVFDKDNFNLLIEDLIQISEIKMSALEINNNEKISPINNFRVNCDCYRGRHGYCGVKTISKEYPCNKDCPAYKMPKCQYIVPASNSDVHKKVENIRKNNINLSNKYAIAQNGTMSGKATFEAEARK